MNHEEKINFLKNFYKDMPDDVFRVRMEKAGFEITEGKPGQLFSDDELDNDCEELE